MNDNDSPALRDGCTIELTQPEQPTHITQHYYAVVLEPLWRDADWQELWLAALTEPDPDRPNAAQDDTRSVLLSPADMRALAVELVARADAIDPPEVGRG